MQVLLDENLPRRLASQLAPEHTVTTVSQQGWSGISNGELLRLAATNFDVLLTMDRGIEYQQQLAGLSLGLLLLRAPSNRFQDLMLLVPEINRLLPTVSAGQLVYVKAAQN